MPKILKPNQDYLPDHVVEVAHLFDDKLDAAQTAANSAQTAANSAQTAANSAQTAANSAQTTANSAQTTANNAVARLAGEQDYYEGTGTFTGTPSNFLPTTLTTVSSQGISWTGTHFNFSYLGKYLVVITQGGECVNSRTDWYQEVTIRLRESVSMTFQPFTFKSIPPSGTWNMENTNSNIIVVAGGNQWRPVINMVVNGSTTNGIFRIKIKKLV